jgi:hypothetical protein
MSALNLDRMIYIVILDHRSGAFLPERNLADLDRKTTVQDIATGQIEDVIAVHEYNPIERTSRDVTDDIMREAAELILEKHCYRDLNDWQRDFVDGQARRAA